MTKAALPEKVYSGEEDFLPSKAAGASRPKRLERARLWPFIIGAFFILVAIAVEHGHHVAGGGASAEEATSAIFSFSTITLLLAELGYAFVIGGVISVFMEMNARRELNDEIRAARSQISRDVIEAIFTVKHSPEYVQAVLGTCLEAAVVREGYDITYDIKEFPTEVAEGAGIDAERFALVDVTIRYVIRNVSGESGTFRTGYGIPHRSSGLADSSRITKLSIGHQSFEGEELRVMEVDHAHGDGNERVYQFDISLEQESSVEVYIEATIAKERSDSDPFGFRRPTQGATIKINDRIGNLIYGVTPRSAANLDTRKVPRVGGGGEWDLVGPILPYDSIVLWWRTPEDDGEPSTAPVEPETAPVEQL